MVHMAVENRHRMNVVKLMMAMYVHVTSSFPTPRSTFRTYNHTIPQVEMNDTHDSRICCEQYSKVQQDAR
jgi:hypothetical protein